MIMKYFPVFDYNQLKIGTISSELVLDAFAPILVIFISPIWMNWCHRTCSNHSKNKLKRFLPCQSRKKWHITSGLPTITRLCSGHRKGAYSDEKARVYEAFDLGFDCHVRQPNRVETSIWVGTNRYPSEIPGLKNTLKTYYSANLTSQNPASIFWPHIPGLRSGHFDKFTARPASQLRCCII